MVFKMKFVLLIAMLLVTPLSWAGKQTPQEEAREMAEVICLAQYELIHSRFTLGLSEEDAIKSTIPIMDEYLKKKGGEMGDHAVSLLKTDLTPQLREIEANPEVVELLKSPPAGFKDHALPPCIEKKTQQIEFLHVFG